METNHVTMRTVSLISRILKPLADEGILGVQEMRVIVSNLRHLASRGTVLPAMQPRLLTQEEAACMLGISKANLKKLEADGKLPIKRKMIGTSVRYRNVDILAFLMAEDATDDSGCNHAE